MKLGLIILAIVFFFVVVFLKPSEDESSKSKKGVQAENESVKKVQTTSERRRPAQVIPEPKEKSLDEEIASINHRLASMFQTVHNADGVVHRSEMYTEFDKARRDSVVQLAALVLEKSQRASDYSLKAYLAEFVKGCDQITMTGPINEMFKFDQIELEQALSACKVQLEKTPDLSLFETEREIKKALDDVLKNLAENHVLKTSISQAHRELTDLGDDLGKDTFRSWLRTQQKRIVGETS